MNTRNRLLVLAAGVTLLGYGTAFAQGVDSSVVERVRQVEQERRTGLAGTETYLKTTGQGRRLTGYGAWFTDTVIDFSDDDKNSARLDPLDDLEIRDLRVWWTTQIGRKFTSYFRLKAQHFDFDTAPGVAEPNFNILEKVDLDLGYFDYRFDNAQRVRAGRQFLQVGRGFVLAEILDGLDYQRVKDGLSIEAFWGTTPNRLLNIDSSIVGFNNGLTRRDFAFLEAQYTHRAGNQYYAYHVSQVDRSDSDSATQVLEDFGYNSNYTGIGGHVRVTPRVLLLTEGGFQGGSALADFAGGRRRVDISASFFEALGLWNLKGANDGLVQAEYAWGSGDPNRRNVTDTFGGKQNLTDDGNFLYFGRVETGVALSPRLSNLHMARLGYQQRIRLSGRQVHSTDPLLGLKFTDYIKDHRGGAISDTLANNNQKHVGVGSDAYLAWRIFSDTVLNVQYGHFQPGNAYPVGTRSASDRLVVSTTLSF